MSYQHTAHCIEETARWNRAIEAYKQAWPNYCQHCNGDLVRYQMTQGKGTQA